MAINFVGVEFKVGEQVVGILAAAAKVFSTGSRGFHATGKVVLDGKNYQCNVQLIEIGSKPADGGKKVAKK